MSERVETAAVSGADAAQAALCYVEDNWAYFTTQPLADQWGDDWNDAPYEHNAEPPYEPCWHRANLIQNGGPLCTCPSCERDWDGAKPRWAIYRVAWRAELDRPCDGHLNSPYSVEQINRGAAPWLRTPHWDSRNVFIAAGTTLGAFIRAIEAVGGEVYLPADLSYIRAETGPRAESTPEGVVEEPNAAPQTP